MAFQDDFVTNPRGYDASLAAPKFKKQQEEPMPSREELLARNSFGSPDDNKYLNRSKKK